MVEVCGVKKLGRFPNIEPPPSKKARTEDVADPPSTSSALESRFQTTSHQSWPADSYPHTPRTSTAVPPSGPSPHVQVCVTSGVGSVTIGMESFWPCVAFLNLHIHVGTKTFSSWVLPLM